MRISPLAGVRASFSDLHEIASYECSDDFCDAAQIIADEMQGHPVRVHSPQGRGALFYAIPPHVYEQIRALIARVASLPNAAELE